MINFQRHFITGRARDLYRSLAKGFSSLSSRLYISSEGKRKASECRDFNTDLMGRADRPQMIYMGSVKCIQEVVLI
jgi:hypothetical protein